MSNRIQTTLRAPIGTEETNVLGTYYDPDDDGLVTTTSDEHLRILKQHGFAVVKTEAVAPVRRRPGALPDLDPDEMGRGELAAALKERDVEHSPTASRNELVALAKRWNQDRQAHAAPPPPAIAPPLGAELSPEVSYVPAAAQVVHTLPVTPGATITQPKPAAAPASTPPPVTSPQTQQAIGDLAYTDLKAWLIAHGVEVKGQPAKIKLVELAEAEMAKNPGAGVPPQAG